MNLYQHKEITNRLDRRLIDLFVQQNQGNAWLTLTQCASWVFETNTPNEYHKTYTKNKLAALIGGMNTSVRAKTFFEMKFTPEVVGRFVYRLKDLRVMKTSKPASLKQQIDDAFSIPPAFAASEYVEGCYFDDLDL